MIKRLMFFGVVAFALAALMASPTQANFVLCPGGECDGDDGATNFADLILGILNYDEIYALEGDDIVFGGDGPDVLLGEDGNDILFGELGSDTLFGEDGNDILLTGVDLPGFTQTAAGGDGNDTINIFASENSTCWFGNGESGSDVANLIGFGPYTAVVPFGQPGFGNDGWAHIVDPITGADILLFVNENDDYGTEVINGLPSPNVTIIPVDDPIFFECLANLPPEVTAFF